MSDPQLTDLLVAAIDYGIALGRLSSDLEPTDVEQTQAALDRARARMVELRTALWTPDTEPPTILVWSTIEEPDADQRAALWERWKEEGDARPRCD